MTCDHLKRRGLFVDKGASCPVIEEDKESRQCILPKSRSTLYRVAKREMAISEETVDLVQNLQPKKINKDMVSRRHITA